MKRNFKEMRVPEYPPSAISFETTLLNKTGSWRIFKPVYENKLPPCNNACPAFENIQKYIYLALNGKYSEAYLTILESNPFPSITGRVCAHPCEVACNRKKFDEPVAVHHIERFIGDWGLEKVERSKSRKVEKSKNQEVAVVGSGPAGMSCAYYLAKAGFKVDVYDKDEEPGGLLRYGIPSYRLPKDVLDKEFKKLKRMGVRFVMNTIFSESNGACSVAIETLRKKYFAVFLAVGAQIEKDLGVKNENAKGVLKGIEFLRELNVTQAKDLRLRGSDKIGRKVLVIGGSFTAIDCARSAVRLGKDVTIVYRRTRNEMPASAEEVKAAELEGVKLIFLAAPARVIVNRRKEVTGLECVRMKLGEPDASGRRRPVPVKGSNFKIAADTIIKAIGESVEFDSLPANIAKTGWGIKATEWGETNMPGVYTAGDCVTGPKTVVDAIAGGRKAAEKIIFDFAVKGDGKGVSPFSRRDSSDRGDVVPFAKLNTFYFDNAARVKMPQINGRTRNTFREVNKGYSKELLSAEAARCFSCGVCNYCDNCYVYCPDVAVKKMSEAVYEFIYDYCKGCGVCAEECPRNAITMYSE
jgi:2-oxoacid:acceptor oxidoreductase delta subunit (pyruvate/2-ketoisovalerate family)